MPGSETLPEADTLAAEPDRRIIFHHGLEVMEAGFSGTNFDTSGTVNRLFNVLARRIRESGKDKWFFLVNLNGCEILPEA